jgi:hypothetical protein
LGKKDTADTIAITTATAAIVPKTFLSTLNQNENAGKKVVIFN